MTETYRINEWTANLAFESIIIHHNGREWPAQARKITGKGLSLWLVEYEPRLWEKRFLLGDEAPGGGGRRWPKGPPFGERRQFLVVNEAGKIISRGASHDDALRAVH